MPRSQPAIISLMYAPNWPTTIRPCGSVSIGNSSCCSRMTGDIALRKSTASISKRAWRSAFSMMSTVTGSTSRSGISAIFISRLPDQQVEVAVVLGDVAVEDHGRGVELGDDRRAGDDRPGMQVGAGVGAGRQHRLH